MDGQPLRLPASFRYGGETVNVDEFLALTDTAALLAPVEESASVTYEH